MASSVKFHFYAFHLPYICMLNSLRNDIGIAAQTIVKSKPNPDVELKFDISLYSEVIGKLILMTS